MSVLAIIPAAGAGVRMGYLAWCEHRLGPGRALPVHLLDRVEALPLLAWLRRHDPDVVVFVHLYDVLESLRTVLRENRIRVPARLGVVPRNA